MMADKWVYTFGGGTAEGNAAMRDLLGGKGANLAEMCALGLPVPPGFTITTAVCALWQDKGGVYPSGLEEQVNVALTQTGNIVGGSFGDEENPLLVSVRSGSRASMPGMMDTVLNLGLNDETVQALARASQDERFAQDAYRRFIQMYANVVMGVPHYTLEETLEVYKEDNGLLMDTDLEADDWRALVEMYKVLVAQEAGRVFPQDVREQLWGAIGAVFNSWDNERARTYRLLNDIPEEWGTAVNVQAMVFGNKGDDSATGVAFTRNPSTGEKSFFGEFLINAQGEDVVSGIRTPNHLTKAGRETHGSKALSMEEVMPGPFNELVEIYKRLEVHYRDMQDMEFTVQEGVLWILQTRAGKRTTRAALKIAVDMVDEGLINKAEAVRRIAPSSLEQLLHPALDPDASREVIATGLPASPGAASGEIVFHAGRAEDLARQGRKVILVRVETSPEDIHGMHVAEGILTTRGGMTSHAAVVARGMGKPCVSGAGLLQVDYGEEILRAGDLVFRGGDLITIDGTAGQVLKGEVPREPVSLSEDFERLMAWADGYRRMKVRANAETQGDVETALRFGAEGIGLCRTEHMFFDQNRILTVRRMILARNEEERRGPLAEILPMQRDDFTILFRHMVGLPVTIRLLDPPLHEFLPRTSEEVQEIANALGISPAEARQKVASLSEYNPMLGHRGCRLGISFPDIYEMQARAIFEAAHIVMQETGEVIIPEIIIPLVAMREEFDALKECIAEVACTVAQECNTSVEYLVGVMIELPRAALRAGDIARSAAFFSFGTNDLTQTVYGISRDDSAGFLNDYAARNIMARDPFVSLDTEGVGELVSLALERGRAARSDLKAGICGEHGGDADSIHFCEEIGLDYVSCSPYRIPIARLAAAHAALNKDNLLRDATE